jgi:uncharacterized membrane protein
MLNFFLNNTPLFYWIQSVWRDEAFSVWIANGSLKDVITRTSGDFNPPLYYALLNIWMKLFGNSEIAARSLSVLFFLLFLVVVYKFSFVLFKDRHHSIFTTTFAALTPMLLYFAFELRMYSAFYFWVTLSTYFLYTKNRLGYVLSAAAGMYTQPFMAFVLVSHGLYLLTTRQLKTAVINFSLVGLLFLPWVPTLLDQFRHSGPMWMYPVDLTLFFSVLGNVFMGYEGTPGGLWNVMKVISLGILIATFVVIRRKKIFQDLQPLILLTYIPLILVLMISLKKPIYVHRYVIFTSVGEVFILSAAVFTLKKQLRTYAQVGLILLLLFTNIWVVSFHRKVDFRATFASINPQLTPSDIVVAANPLSYYESWYYTIPGHTAYLYNPDGITPPRYVGSSGMPESVWLKTLPQFPARAFIVNENGSYTINSTLVK